MNEAIKVYSTEKGYFTEILEATKIKSHSHARMLAPFVDDSYQLLYWVNWGKPKLNDKPRKAHFRHYPKNKTSIVETISKEIKHRKVKSKESQKHIKAKECILNLLRNMLKQKKHIPWAFKDPETSDFPMTGDFLAGAVSIEKEYQIKTPFGEKYRLDIAIMGKVIGKEPVVLAGIEVEFTHKFDFSKALICKTLGFPLISIDIVDENIESIDTQWAKQSLIETTKNSADGYRRNFIYIHKMLSTFYIDIPRELKPESKHQYVIFTQEQATLIRYLKKLKELLNLSDRQVIIQPVTDKNEQLHVQVENAGNLAGAKWKDHNSESFVQLTIEKPCTKSGDLYYFHLVLANICNSILDCLVGYKYELGQIHEIGDSLIWKKLKKINGELIRYNVAPKRISEPVRQILAHVARNNS
ncbi:MAG: hypothetical protein KAR12_05160 [Methylococcales bacterium]|nr:hypothetical protein [Methylococcales bacterium]